MRELRCLIGVILATAAWVSPAAAAPVPSVRGVQIPAIYPDTATTSIDADLDQAQALGANTVRLEVNWAALEPTREQLSPDYALRLDHFVNGAHARGIRPLLVVLRTPCWATIQPTGCNDFSNYPPRDAADYGWIAGQIAQRYNGMLAGFEVWNEPDLGAQYYFAGADKPGHYAALLKAAYRAIKVGDPGLPVLAGSLVGANGVFLRALYAQGIKGFYDGLAVHYYDLTLSGMRAIHKVQLAHHDHTPLWLTEFGWTSCYPASLTEGPQPCVSATQQASDIGDVFRAVRGVSWVRAAVVYTLRDIPGQLFGLLSTSGQRKLAWFTVAHAFQAGLGGPRAVTARVHGRVLSGRVPAGDVVTISGYQKGRFFYRVTLVPDRFGRFSLKLPKLVRNARLVVTQPWTRRSATVFV
jgi:hypothetical protein